MKGGGKGCRGQGPRVGAPVGGARGKAPAWGFGGAVPTELYETNLIEFKGVLW